MNVTHEFLQVKNSSHPISQMMEDPNLRKAYNTQYRNAKRRGIGFHMSYEEWLLVWVASGCLHLRGKHAGQYQMCRDNDSGDYVLGNVYIAQMEENLHQAHFGKRKTAAHRRKLKANLAKQRKHVVVSANGVIYQSLTECGKAHNLTAQGVKTRIRSNSDSFKDWKVERVAKGYTNNIITFPSRAEEIDLSDMMNMADDFDFEAFVEQVSK